MSTVLTRSSPPAPLELPGGDGGRVSALEARCAQLEAELVESRAVRARLAAQVKALVDTEGKLYLSQRAIDLQIRLYRRLNEAVRGLTATFDIHEILRKVIHFAIYDAEFERAVALVRRNDGAFAVVAHDGYYDETGPTLDARTLTLSPELVRELRAASGPIVSLEDETSPERRALGEQLFLDEYLASPIGVDDEKLHALIVVGNTRADWSTFTRVRGDGERVVVLANIFSQAATSVQNAALYNALDAERRSLEDKVRERTLAVSTANEELKRADRLKTQFFTNVSHELRTPLTLSVGPLHGILRDEQTPAAIRGTLGVVYDNQLRLMKLINDLLDFSKLEAGRMTGRFVRTELPSVLLTFLGTLRAAAENRGIALRTSIEGAIGDVFVDLGMLEKIVMNLLSNAFKFTPDGGAITLSVVDTGEDVRATVADTGPGIPKAAQARLFERFAQLDGSDTRKYSGTGIGLALVKELMQVHRGSVTVTSEAGSGASFTLVFPKGTAHLPPDQVVLGDEARAEVTPQAHQLVEFQTRADAHDEEDAEVEAPVLAIAAVAAPPSSREPAAASARPHVLVVDDTADMRAYIASMLKPHYRVSVARDGAEGIEKARRLLPDVIVSDVMMPNKSGYDLCDELKGDAGPASSIPVMLVTAKAELAMKIEGLRHGADDYLVKPFHADELLVRVQNLATSRRRAQDLARAHAVLAQKERAIADDLEKARTFQRAMLDNLPAPAWATVAAVYAPLDLVGGDVYDVSLLSEGGLRLFVADAIGHGVQASLRTMILKAEYDRVKGLASPAAALGALNARLCGGYPRGELMTSACCLDIVPNDRGGADVAIVSAGHPPLLAFVGGRVHEIQANGPLLGVGKAIDLALVRTELPAGARLVAFTDGLDEQRSEAGQAFGVERLAASIDRPPVPLRRALERAVEQVLAFAKGHSVDDDMTLVGVDIGADPA
jgi:signal transduction histidine kinase/serine phosphatase RsbU (regulator of sigma subunit)